VAVVLRNRIAVVKKAESSYEVTFVIAIVNGEERPVEDGQTIADLLRELCLGGRRIAVELNRDIVPAAEYASRAIREGDTIEIVQFVGGG
jgi:sulfur carrier protein